MSKHPKSKLFGILFLPLIALSVLTLFFFGGIINSLPKRAEEIYGAPDPDLNTTRLYYQSLLLIMKAEQLTTPTNLQGGIQAFHIDPGESPRMIIRRLHDMGLIDDPRLLRTYIIYAGIDKKIQAGDYFLSPVMSEVEIAEALQDPNPQEVSLTIFPGWRMEEIAAVLPELGVNISPQDFIREVNRRDKEGYLYPDTYQIQRDVSPPLLVDTLSQAFEDHFSPHIKEGMTQQGLTPREGVILASIVEKEAVLREEMPLIASVFLNRLRAGMALGADPTIQYALGYNEAQGTWWTNPLSTEDFSVNSPYNTYQNKGLPPGPICNPSLTALQAVAFAEPTPYYYFSAACDGSGRHNFSKTFEEHQQNICP
ncbi:MAG: endolytic transglycosylase MltG [Anaerolineales bacterium]